jgi:uncharacterized membrane protein YfcA
VDKANIKTLLPGAVIGIALGSLGFHYLSEDSDPYFNRPNCSHFCLFTGLQPSVIAQGAQCYLRWIWGAVAGFVQFVFTPVGPPVNMYFTAAAHETLLMGTMAIFFFCRGKCHCWCPYSL